MEFFQSPFLTDPKFLVAAASIILLIFVVVFWLRAVAKNKFEAQLQQVVKSISVEYKQNIYLPDGVGGLVFIDYMILSHYGIIILIKQNYPGVLFGGENIDSWTQIYKRKSYKFENPLHYLRVCIQSVKEVVPDVTLISQIVFTQAGEFPKGKPEGVCLTLDLLKHIESQPRMDVIPGSLKADWEKLKAANSVSA